MRREAQRNLALETDVRSATKRVRPSTPPPSLPSPPTVTPSHSLRLRCIRDFSSVTPPGGVTLWKPLKCPSLLGCDGVTVWRDVARSKHSTKRAGDIDSLPCFQPSGCRHSLCRNALLRSYGQHRGHDRGRRLHHNSPRRLAMKPGKREGARKLDLGCRPSRTIPEILPRCEIQTGTGGGTGATAGVNGARISETKKTMPESNPAACRRSAERCRRRADAAVDETSKAAWLRFADEWLKLADEAEISGYPCWRGGWRFTYPNPTAFMRFG
jgi:hypothetical protein